MIEIKSLENIDFDIIYTAFSKAFKDYEIQINHSELKNMLIRRGFVAKLSFAAFDGNDIVAFTLNGIDTFNGIKTAYDTGTGTIKEFRGQGLASQIFEYSIPFLKEVNISQYLLEVLQHNIKAVSIYKKLGFKVNREFNYFVRKMDEVKLNSKKMTSTYQIAPINLKQCELASDFQDFHPSWQNSLDAISRESSRFVYLGAFKSGKMVGFCIFQPSSGDITQIAVNKPFRRQGIGTLLLNEILKFNQHREIKLINTEINCESVNKFMKYHSFPLSGKQFEMIKDI